MHARLQARVQRLASAPLHDAGMDALHPLPTTLSEAFALLRMGVAGAVWTPDDARYGELQPRVGDHLARPAAIVVAADANDVVEALRMARANHLAVAVRSTGHRAGAPADGALLVDVSALDRIDVDPEACTVSVGAGATWGDVVARTIGHGLAPVPGEWSGRAAVSDTLAGGMGWLARRHGLACDNVARYELVTPDGLLVDVTPDCQPELFWALSGAGDGSLGVVTAIEFELHAVRPAYAGSITYPHALAEAVCDRWRVWTTNVRPELTTSLVLTPQSIAVHGCWVGAPEAGRTLVDDWRAWYAPAADDWRRRAPGDLDAVNPTVLAPGARATAAMTNVWANALRDELLGELLRLVADGTAEAVEIRLAGGAARARSAAAANGHGRRDQYLITLAGLDRSRDDARARLAAWTTGATYLDRTDPAERTARISDAFAPADLARLAAVKAALDPGARFRHGLPL